MLFGATHELCDIFAERSIVVKWFGIFLGEGGGGEKTKKCFLSPYLGKVNF